MSTLDSFRDDLVLDIDETLSLIRTINSLLSMTLPPHAGVTPLQRDLIVEWAFVHLHAEWENFLESTFIAYMLGSQTNSGYSPTRYVFPIDEQHALGIIRAGREFFQWTKPGKVNEQSSLCFQNGEPFRPVLESTMTDLKEMTVIRNAIVHKSTVALDKFKTLVRNRLRTAPLGITPGSFLITLKPRTVRTTFLISYCHKLQIIANKLIP